MNERERDLFLIVHAGDAENLPYLYMLYPHLNRRAMLEHLLSKGLKGKLFTEWVRKECRGEPIRLFAKLSKEIEKVNTPSKLILGINIK